jgi:hypothetical protein
MNKRQSKLMKMPIQKRAKFLQFSMIIALIVYGFLLTSINYWEAGEKYNRDLKDLTEKSKEISESYDRLIEFKQPGKIHDRGNSLINSISRNCLNYVLDEDYSEIENLYSTKHDDAIESLNKQCNSFITASLSSYKQNHDYGEYLENVDSYLEYELSFNEITEVFNTEITIKENIKMALLYEDFGFSFIVTISSFVIFWLLLSIFSNYEDSNLYISMFNLGLVLNIKKYKIFKESDAISINDDRFKDLLAMYPSKYHIIRVSGGLKTTEKGEIWYDKRYINTQTLKFFLAVLLLIIMQFIMVAVLSSI